jgi:DNA-directed RNA polymerase sigma subunit (sigma70/sigma32)
MRFGLRNGTEHTLREVGRSLSLSANRIQQIESKALRKLRNPRNNGHLRPFSR